MTIKNKIISILHTTFSLSGCLASRASPTTTNEKSGQKETWTPTPAQSITMLLTGGTTFLTWAILTKITPQKYSPSILLGLITLFLLLTTYGFHYLQTNDNKETVKA